MRDAGLVTLDDHLTTSYPTWGAKDPSGTTRPRTLRQLASHTSGLPREVSRQTLLFT